VSARSACTSPCTTTPSTSSNALTASATILEELEAAAPELGQTRLRTIWARSCSRATWWRKGRGPVGRREGTGRAGQDAGATRRAALPRRATNHLDLASARSARERARGVSRNDRVHLARPLLHQPHRHVDRRDQPRLARRPPGQLRRLPRSPRHGRCRACGGAAGGSAEDIPAFETTLVRSPPAPPRPARRSARACFRRKRRGSRGGGRRTCGSCGGGSRTSSGRFTRSRRGSWRSASGSAIRRSYADGGACARRRRAQAREEQVVWLMREWRSCRPRSRRMSEFELPVEPETLRGATGEGARAHARASGGSGASPTACARYCRAASAIAR